MRISSTTELGVTVIAVEGVIRVGESAEELSRTLRGALGGGRSPVLLDLEGIDYVDSTGLGELVGYLQRFESEGRRLALLNPRDRILALLRLTRLDGVFTIFDDRAEAIERLRGA